MAFSAVATKALKMMAAPKSSNPQMDCKSILIIEDDIAIREMMKDVLEIEGYSIASAGDGKEGLERLKALPNPPGAIILDLMMPVMNGWGFLDILRRDPVLASIPVIVCSAYRESAKSIKPDAIIEKPVKLDRLLEVVNSFCDTD